MRPIATRSLILFVKPILLICGHHNPKRLWWKLSGAEITKQWLMEVGLGQCREYIMGEIRNK